MSDTFTFTCIQGKLKGQKWTYNDGANIVFGRHSRTDIRTPAEENTISRFQAKVDIRPPRIYLCDFGSKNGTYLNGEIIGKREAGQSVEEGRKIAFPAYELKDGDQIGLGPNGDLEVFRVNILLEPEEDQEDQLTNDTDFKKMLEGIKGQLNDEIKEEKKLGDFLPRADKKYKVVKKLGEGGFASVFLVEAPKTKKKYALKEMRPEVKMKQNQVNWFLREASIAKQLNHKNVIKTVSVGEEDGNMYILMEYCSKGSVMDLLRQKGRLELKEATDILLQILEGLDYIHHAPVTVKDKNGVERQLHGVVHRDIKPDNMLFASNGMVKISDLGLAKAFDLAGMSGGTMTGQTVASFLYAPRKQAMRYRYAKPDVDVFCAVSSYYFMLTGRPIRNFKSVPHKEIYDLPVVPIEERDPSIPPALARVVDRVLGEDEIVDSARCITAKALREEIISALDI